MPINRQMDRQNLILISQKKEWNSDTSYKMAEPWKHAQGAKLVAQSDKYCVNHFYEALKQTTVQTENRSKVTRSTGLKSGMGVLLFNVHRAPIWDDKDCRELEQRPST